MWLGYLLFGGSLGGQLNKRLLRLKLSIDITERASDWVEASKPGFKISSETNLSTLPFRKVVMNMTDYKKNPAHTSLSDFALGTELRTGLGFQRE